MIEGEEMATNALVSFEANWETIGHLLEVGADTRRSQNQIAAVNRAALVFCITAWESYVEDVAREAADYIADNCARFSDLPKEVRKTVVAKVTPHDYPRKPDGATDSGARPSDLADDGWRRVYRDLVYAATEGSAFNTPKADNVRALFQRWFDLDVTDSWRWQKFPAPEAAERLDESIRIRGSIIHTGEKPQGINKNWINTYGERNIRKLVEKTDAALIPHVRNLCITDGTPVAFG